MGKLNNLGVLELKKLIKNREIKVSDILDDCFDRIEKVEEKVHAFNSLMKDKAYAKAEAIEKDLEMGKEDLKLLEGIPVILKDNMLSKDDPTTASSRMLEGYKSVYNGHVVDLLESHGAIPIGKSNLDEFAMGSSTEHSAFGVSRNPWDLNKVPGGSSGGSSAAVAASMAPIALGSDTGGSVRQPASFCGLVGIKPTYGRVSRHGLISFASSLDQIGPLTRSVEDMALAMEAIAGYDPKDSTSSTKEVPHYIDSIKGDISNLKIGILEDPFLEGLDEGVAKEFKKSESIFRDLGAKTEKINIPGIGNAIEAYFIIAPSEVCSNLSRFDGLKYGLAPKDPDSYNDIYIKSRTNGFGNEVKRRIMIGNYALSAGHYDAYYKKAYRVRHLVKRAIDEALEKVDVILMPTTPTTAFGFGDNLKNPLKMYLSDIFTACANLSGHPAISVPSGLYEGMPVGMQLLGRHFDEALLLKVSYALEQARGELKMPNLGDM